MVPLQAQTAFGTCGEDEKKQVPEGAAHHEWVAVEPYMSPTQTHSQGLITSLQDLWSPLHIGVHTKRPAEAAVRDGRRAPGIVLGKANLAFIWLPAVHVLSTSTSGWQETSRTSDN